MEINILIFSGIIGFLVLSNGGYFLLKKIIKQRSERYWESLPKTLISIRVSKDNEIGPIAAEQMLASLHGILRKYTGLEGWRLRWKGQAIQEHFSFEIAVVEQQIRFYLWAPTHLREYIEAQFYAQYGSIEIEEVEDYAIVEPELAGRAAVREIVLQEEAILPIRQYVDFMDKVSGGIVDPLSAVLSTMSDCRVPTEKMWVQVLCRPLSDQWQKKGQAYVAAARKGGKKSLLSKSAEGESVNLSDEEKARIQAINNKSMKLGYEVKIRIAYMSPNLTSSGAAAKLDSLFGGFKQFNTTNLNGFAMDRVKVKKQGVWRKVLASEAVELYSQRKMIFTKAILNTEELATIVHLPDQTVTVPNIVWVVSKKTEPPSNLPIIDPEHPDDDITTIGVTNYRNARYKFGIKNGDRQRHMYIIGKTGMGKSVLLENMIYSDLQKGRGVGFIDPHGDSAETVLSYVPRSRVNDVLFFDPADRDNPVGFNMFDVPNPEHYSVAASGIIGVFKRIFGNSWGPRLEHILRNTILALMETPNATLLAIPRMYADKDFREKVIARVTDPVVKSFWEDEYKQMQPRQQTEAVAPIQNKVGQFLSSPIMRNILGQPKSTINLRQAMDEGKIVILRLSKGLVGEDNVALLGSMMITRFQIDAMSRADIPEKDRRDFFLYVDEFQNFSTDSFATILSEARKYHLSLTMANQYLGQMTEMSDTVKDAVFGNVGTLISFQVGFDDAEYLQHQFSDLIEANDLVEISKYSIYSRLLIDGMPSRVFSAATLPPVEIEDAQEHVAKIKAVSRERYASSRDKVEEKIGKWSERKRPEKKSKSKKPWENKNKLKGPTDGSKPEGKSAGQKD